MAPSIKGLFSLVLCRSVEGMEVAAVPTSSLRTFALPCLVLLPSVDFVPKDLQNGVAWFFFPSGSIRVSQPERQGGEAGDSHLVVHLEGEPGRLGSGPRLCCTVTEEWCCASC